jgi:hypothetical protein
MPTPGGAADPVADAAPQARRVELLRQAGDVGQAARS